MKRREPHTEIHRNTPFEFDVTAKASQVIIKKKIAGYIAPRKIPGVVVVKAIPRLPEWIAEAGIAKSEDFRP